MDQISNGDAIAFAADPVDHRPTRKRALLVLLCVLGLVVAAVASSGIYLASLATSFDSKTEKIPTAFPVEKSRPAKSTAGAVNILVLGSDSRGAILDDAKKGIPSDQRTDSMMWVHVPADRSALYIVSIMRDTWVPIPGKGEAKINASMAYGGIPLVVQTFEKMFSERVDHVVVADFEGFKDVTDELGGVDVKVPSSFTSAHGGFSFIKGQQTLTGEQALAFVRERYAFADGDYQRVKNQQLFFKALLAKLMQSSTLANPVKVNNLVATLAPHLQVDPGFNSSQVAKLLLSLRGLKSTDVQTLTLPNLGVGTSADGQSIVVADSQATGDFAAALNQQTVGAYFEKHKQAKSPR